MTNARRHDWLVLAILLACFVIVGGSFAAPYEIRFQSGAVTPAAGQFDIPAAPAHCLIQFNEPLHKGQREALAATGVELLVYLPDRAYVAAVRSTADAVTLAGLGLRHVSLFVAEYKLHPRVANQDFGSWSMYPGQKRIFSVDLMPDIPFETAEFELKKIGCEVGNRFEAIHAVLIAIEPERINDVAGLDVVLFINEASPPMDMVNDIVRNRLHVNEIQAAPYNLNGDSVTILVYDGGMIDSTHPDFGDRVTWNEMAAIADHPTHVGGTVGGDGTQSSGNYRGMAPAAHIISGQYDACIPYCLYESPNDFEEDYTLARTEHHIELTTNSIGANIDPNGYPCEWFGDYETTSRLLDGMVLNTAGSPLIMFFAAGNERNGTSCGFSQYRCMSVPAGAKNIITCGSTSSANASSSFSSWGPTDDGRIKPEVSATGENVTSCRPGPSYGYQDMSGTSMATPATSGTACLILQQWHRLFPGASDPLPETMKAILISSAADIEQTGPDYRSGFGLVNGLQAVQNLLGGGVLESALQIDEEFTSTFIVPTGLTQLNIGLAWSDIPAAGNVTPTLVNDLNLVLVDPDGASHDPWVMRENPAIPAIRGHDSVNVCEKVTVDSPVAGQWTLHVTGTLNGSETQTFGLSGNVALVTSWAAVTGQIQDANAQGIPGQISVVGGSQTAISDAQGNYILYLPAGGSFTLQALSYGYVPDDSLVNLSGPATVNFSLRTAQNGTITGVVQNQFSTPLPGALVRFGFPNAAIPSQSVGPTGSYSAQLPGANFYDVTGEYFGGTQTVRAFVPENSSVTANITIDDDRFAPAGPDGYGYLAYEIADPALNAAYDWMEISPRLGGPGALLQGTGGNDWIVDINLPFTVQFYGQQNTLARVAADGWVSFGASQNPQRAYRNVQIPNDTLPNAMVCVFWDDMIPYASNNPDSGDISSYYDQPNGRYIIEYHHVPQFLPRSNFVTAQVVIYDLQTRPTATGDNEILIQYQEFDYVGPGSTVDADATIGIENPDGTDGIQIVFDGTYDLSCFEIDSGSAIRFTTGVPLAYGTVHGQLTMIPAAPDITLATITAGNRTGHPLQNGSYEIDSVVAGTQNVQVTLTGYENGQTSVVVPADDDVEANFTLYRLDPARNLTGEYNGATHQIHLTWRPPDFQDGQSLDELTSYRITLAGTGALATVTDTFYTYTAQATRDYDFWITAMYDGGVSDTSNHYRVYVDLAVSPIANAIPTEYFLSQNFPNPFNPTTYIEYGLPITSHVRLAVFDVLGRNIMTLQNGVQSAGSYRAAFDGSGMGSGVYYCRMEAGNFVSVRKMLLLR